jgi:hypothetical protein
MNINYIYLASGLDYTTGIHVALMPSKQLGRIDNEIKLSKTCKVASSGDLESEIMWLDRGSREPYWWGVRGCMGRKNPSMGRITQV